MNLADLTPLASGKVRDIYQVDDEHLLLVTSDRISAFDWILSTQIPDKGRILTAMSVWWFQQVADLAPSHFVSADDERIPREVVGRAILCRKLTMIDVECVARGYLAGSGTKDYNATGTICGVQLPAGLVEGSQLPEPIFTPATKAPIGNHDENISFSVVVDHLGADLAHQIKDLTVGLYKTAYDMIYQRGMILADTKIELGHDKNGVLTIGDEILTPDSSRFWAIDDWQPGKAQPPFDKQYVRDWLANESGWDRNSEPPPLPESVVAATRARYIEAYERITGLSFKDWLTPS